MLQSTKEKFAQGYRDFDRAVYCIARVHNYDPGLAAIAHLRARERDMDRAGVRRAAIVVLAACACMRSSSKDDRAAPAAASPSEAPRGEPHTRGTDTTAPFAIAPRAVQPSTAIPIDSVAGARAAIGKRVRVEGTGDNAKLGAVVVKGDLVVYCVDRKDGWDERNVSVVVEGILEYTSHTRARSGSDGSISAGTGEPIFQMTCDLVR